MLLVKTVRGLERIAASRIEEILTGAKAIPRPSGYLGLVIVEGVGEPERAADLVRHEVPEAEKILPVLAMASADLEEIAKAAAEAARGRIASGESFAVRTTRRGSHRFTSIDVNVAAGAAVQRATGAAVNLSYPDKIVWIEVLGDKALISVTSGREERKKTYPGKPYVRRALGKIVVGQMPYVDSLEACRKMGVRIGRAAQTFEIGALYVTPHKPVEGKQLAVFLEGVYEGIESRYEIQTRTYHEKPRRVPVYVQDLYQFVRDKRGKPLVVTSTRGEPLSKVADELAELFRSGDEVVVLIGAREGIPTGVFRFANLVVDLAPGITISTDHALTSAIVGFVTALEEKGVFEVHSNPKI